MPIALLRRHQHARAVLEPFPCHGRFRRDRPHWLEATEPLNEGLLVVGCRAGLPAVVRVPASSGVHSLPLQCAADSVFFGKLFPEPFPSHCQHMSSRPDRSGLTGVCFLSRERNTRQTDSEQPLVRFRFPFSVCRSCCATPGSQPWDHPASTLDPPAAPPEAGCPQADFVHAVLPPCVHHARHAPLGIMVHTGPVGLFAAVSLSRGVPLPECRTFTQPGRICFAPFN